MTGRISNRASSGAQVGVVITAYTRRQREVEQTQTYGVNELMKFAGFTSDQIDTLYTLFKERENKERLSGKHKSTTFELILDSVLHIT